MSFEELDHTADVRIRISAESYEELFTLAADALFSILYSGECRPVFEKKIQILAENQEDLLWEFLSELLYLSLIHI